MKKEIKITVKNREKLEQELKVVNGKLENALTPTDLFETIKIVEKRLTIPKCHMDGITVRFSPFEYWAYTLPQAYKYTPIIVACKLINRKGNWYLCSVWRDYGKSNRGNRLTIDLTPKAESIILDRIRNF